ncbi:unnamed protein product [Trichogramma brassicae]|uniref:Phosphodiesterase n=1 Tax=Trichogramma brassicae TaxID=86971 RepID=A0A6H5HWQ5_9HYME|nr:unnamed protein product [Trichogramma brassicae]
MVIHVLGETILQQELRFPITSQGLQRAVQNGESSKQMVLELNRDLVEKLREMVSPLPEVYLCVPVQHPIKQQVALVVCLVGVIDDAETSAVLVCTKIVQECFRYCLSLLLSTLKCQEETKLRLQCQDLLVVSKRLFTRLGDLTDLLREIMTEARKLTKAERCSLFLLESEQQELVAKVFDGLPSEERVYRYMLQCTQEMRIAIGQGIAGHVAMTGKLLNIRNAYEHPLFYRGIDEVTGFKTRNILCFPIRDEKGIIGVAQLCNKINGNYFDVNDEEVAMAFSIYCGISIMHSIVYKKIQDAQARSKLSNELMMYHMQVDLQVEEEDVQALLNCGDDHNIKDFDSFNFCPRTVPYRHMPCYVLKMFEDLNFIKRWRIKKNVLARFTLYVKKGYRDAPYHNWMHAFSVAHFAYLLIKNLRLVEEEHMTELQAFVFLVSCLCHDIDHRGTNNSFQTKCGTVLASLYSSEGSVMERHHLAQSMCILNTEGCNIFETLKGTLYSEALDLLRNNILATDLASHFRSVDDQREITRCYDKKNPSHRKLLHAMLMTCCDLNDQTKNWKVSKQTAEQIYDEFFSQGDLEKSMGTAPIEMMDREGVHTGSAENFSKMDKKAILLMLQSDAERISKEASDISRSVEKMKEDTINYIEALLTQVRTGAGPLLAKTPKMTRKRAATKIKSIPEDDVGEADEVSDSSSSQRSLRSSRANSENLETSDAKPARMKRGASVRAANSIRKQQAEGLNTKLRRPSANDSDVPLAVRIKSERLSKRPKETTSSDEEDSRPLKQKRMDKDETSKEVINDDTQDVVLELSHCEENQTYNSTRQTRTSVKRKLETSSEDNNVTLTEKQSFYSEEPVAKKANKFKSPPQRNEKFTNTLNRISEKSTPNETPQQPKVSPRVTRSSASSASSTSVVKAVGSTKLKNRNVINETVEADETMVSMYEDAVAKPPMMNSTMNPNTTVTLERMMNVTVLLDPIPNKVCDETVTIQKAPPKKKLSSSEIKEMARRRSSKESKNVGSGTKTQQTLRLEQFNEIMTDDESSPERKGYRLKKNQKAPPPKRQTRSSQMFESSDSEVEVKKTPLKILPSKDFKTTIAAKAAFKQAALFSPYSKDSVKKRVEAFEQVASSPKFENETTGRVTRTKTRALAAANTQEERTPSSVAQKLARKSLAKAKKISLAKQARECDETKEYTKPMTSSRNIVTHVDSFIQSSTKSAQKTIDRVAEEKRRRAHEEDARRKRDELLKAAAEEKRRRKRLPKSTCQQIIRWIVILTKRNQMMRANQNMKFPAGLQSDYSSINRLKNCSTRKIILILLSYTRIRLLIDTFQNTMRILDLPGIREFRLLDALNMQSLEFDRGFMTKTRLCEIMFDVNFDDQKKIEKVKSFRKDFNLDVQRERYEFLQHFDTLINEWNGQFSNPREIFQNKEIERLLSDSISLCGAPNDYRGARFIDFVVRSGYKDEPELDEEGEVLYHRTTPVHQAARFQYNYIVGDLFEVYDRCVNYTDEFGYTHYDVAFEFDCNKVVEKFLELGQDPNCLLRKSNSSMVNPSHVPLHVALTKRCRSMVRLLLKKGADPNLADAQGLTALHVICKSLSDDHDLARILFKHSQEKYRPVLVDAKDKMGQTPLHYAVTNSCKELSIRVLLENGADPNVRNAKGLSPLQVICQGADDNSNLVQMLIEISLMYKPVQVNIQDALGNTPLLRVLLHNQRNMFELLLQKGADPNVTNKEGSTALHIISKRFWLDDLAEMVFELSHKNHQPLQIDIQDKDGNTPLHLALMFDKKRVADLLLKKGANPNLVNAEGRTPLHIFSKMNPDIKWIESFFDFCDKNHHPMQVNVPNKAGNTPLHLALRCSNRKVSELLLARGANPHSANAKGLTPLHIICRDNITTARMLFERSHDQFKPLCVDVQDEEGNTPLHEALLHKARDNAKFLMINGADVNLTNARGSSPLHIICEYADLYDLAELLFQIFYEKHQTVQINAQNIDGNTPLHLALYWDNKRMVELLLRNGADPNSVNVEGSTPLHLICKEEKNSDMIEMFFNIAEERHQPVQVNVVDRFGQTPLQWAVSNFKWHSCMIYVESAWIIHVDIHAIFFNWEGTHYRNSTSMMKRAALPRRISRMQGILIRRDFASRAGGIQHLRVIRARVWIEAGLEAALRPRSAARVLPTTPSFFESRSPVQYRNRINLCPNVFFALKTRRRGAKRWIGGGGDRSRASSSSSSEQKRITSSIKLKSLCVSILFSCAIKYVVKSGLSVKFIKKHTAVDFEAAHVEHLYRP